MFLYVVCHKHKEVIHIGHVPREEQEVLAYRGTATETLWMALSQFIRDHAHCGCVLTAEKEFYELDLSGYKRKDNAYGIPFKGPEDVYDQ